MSGYKETILSFNPKCFITFDADSLYDTGSWYLRHENITDESGNNNHAWIHQTSELVKSYAMGAPSLIPRETNAENHSFTFSPRSYDLTAVHPYEKTLLEIFDAESLKLKDEFTIMFVVNKVNNEQIFRGQKWNYTTSQYENTWQGTKPLTRQVFNKGDKLSCRWVWTSLYNRLYFGFPGNEGFIPMTTAMYNQNLHIMMRRKMKSLGGGFSQTTDTVWLNGFSIYSYTSEISTTPITAENTSSILIGGNQDVSDPDYLNDRQTTTMTIDQFTIFDYALDDNQAYSIYKKMNTYMDTLKIQSPDYYLVCDDVKSLTKLYLENIGNTIRNSTFLVGTNDDMHMRRQLGPDRLAGDVSILFKNGGMLRYRSVPTTGLSPAFNLTTDFTLSFWCKFSSLDRGVIASLQNEDSPFNGILVQSNVRNNEEDSGSIQFSMREGLYICPAEFTPNGEKIYYNDDVWRLIHFIRRGDIFEVWIDSNKVGELPTYVDTITINNIYFMGMAPGTLSTNGNICHVALFYKALQPQQIIGLSNFYVRQIIRGRVTVQNVARKIMIRVFDHATGQLITEQYCNPETGDYLVEIYSNNYIDIMFLDPSDNNVKYKSFGPVLASQVFDIDF